MTIDQFLWATQRALFSFGVQTGRLAELDRFASLSKRLLPRAVSSGLIVIGDGSDGSYVVPDDLTGISHLISPGVGDSCQFENAISKMGISCRLFDGTVDRPGRLDARAEFQRINISGAQKPGHMTLKNTIPEEHDDLILQIDVEGAEYDIIPGSKNVLASFRVIIIEIHGVEQWATSMGFGAATNLLDALTSFHSPIYLRANPYRKPFRHRKNVLAPSAIEVTLLRNDRFLSKEVELAKLENLPLFGSNDGYVPELLDSWSKGMKEN